MAKKKARADEPEKPSKPPKKKETTAEFIASMAGVFVVGLFIITFNLQAFEIPSSSMENTLLIGDHLFVDRISYAPATGWMPLEPYTEVKRNDIVVFISPAEAGLHVVKRIVGVPGDHIRVREGHVWINGKPVDEPYAIHDPQRHDPARENFPGPFYIMQATPEWRLTMNQYLDGEDIVVPPDRYFGMGDNRDWSYDGRYWGFIPRENIIGRPTFIYWSFQTPRDQYEKHAIADRIGWIFTVIFKFPTQTRWERMFHRVK